jgi:hypothetical protein
MIPWQVDISYWQDWELPLKDMVAHGLNRVIIKNDSRLDEHVAQCLAAPVDYDIYAWVDPIYSIPPQVNRLVRAIAKYRPKGVGVDAEQWWASWKLWDLAIKGRLPWARVPILGPKTINNTHWQFVNLLAPQLPQFDIPFIDLYTGKWFVGAYCPQMGRWIGTGSLRPWLAQYFDRGKKPYKVTWEQFEAILKTIGAPTLPKGCTWWHRRQISSRLIFEGCRYQLDTNIEGGDLYRVDA